VFILAKNICAKKNKKNKRKGEKKMKQDSNREINREIYIRLRDLHCYEAGRRDNGSVWGRIGAVLVWIIFITVTLWELSRMVTGY